MPLFTLERGKTVASQHHVQLAGTAPSPLPRISYLHLYIPILSVLNCTDHLSLVIVNLLHYTLDYLPLHHNNHYRFKLAMVDFRVAPDVPEFAMLWLPPFPSQSATNSGLVPFHMWSQPGIYIVSIGTIT